MTPNSILIKSITGQIYKITDLVKGIKRPLLPSELVHYDMYAQSGILKDTDGTLVDLVELLTSGGKVQIVEEEKPENPLPNAIYVDKNSRSISIFDEEIGEWIDLGSGDETVIFSPDNALNDDDLLEVVNIFSTLNTKEK